MRNLFHVRSLLLSVLILAVSGSAFGQIGFSITLAPPVLPVYEQPICTNDGYIWTPGYWGYGDDGYFWVPGDWVQPPEVGFLWTPGYWGWGGNAYAFHEGYWGQTVGFYGGISYGFGYNGNGYEGGRWNGGRFEYNTSVNRVNTTIIHNTYNTRVVENNTRVSFNGGSGGIEVRATAQQEAAGRERHVAPVAAQTHTSPKLARTLSCALPRTTAIRPPALLQGPKTAPQPRAENPEKKLQRPRMLSLKTGPQSLRAQPRPRTQAT
jgi:hypothetical protein